MKNAKDPRGVAIPFTVLSQVCIIEPNDLPHKYITKVKESLDVYLTMYESKYAIFKQTDKQLALTHWLIPTLKPIEFLLSLFMSNNYDECTEDPSKIY